MKNKFFLRGECGIGKSTILAKVRSQLVKEGYSLAGLQTFHGADDKKIYLSDLNNPQHKQVIGDYNEGFIFYEQVFSSFGCELLAKAKQADFIYLDELGFIESKSQPFQQAVYDLLAEPKPIIGVLRLKEIAWHQPILQHQNVELLTVDLSNREHLPALLLAKLESVK